MAEWQIIILAVAIGCMVGVLQSINNKLAAILFVLRHQSGMDRDE